MTIYMVTGVDPGLVHTGVVSLIIDTERFEVNVSSWVVNGCDPRAVAEVHRLIKDWQNIHIVPGSRMHTFVEDYNPRSHFSTDKDLTRAVADLRRMPRTKVIDNAGVKKVIRRDLMRLLKVWGFSTKTNHGDLRSAAYILLYGMVKNDELNALLYQIVDDHLGNQRWDVLD